MKRYVKHASLFLLVVLATTYQAAAQGTAFTYQGRLQASGQSANGLYDLSFQIFDAANASNGQGSFITNGLGVTNGLFTITLDFGNQFNGASRWLQIGVSTNLANNFFTLTPRQQITPAPYAITAGNVVGLQIQPNIADGAPNVIGGAAVNFVSPGTVGVTIAGGGATNYLGSVYANSVYGNFGTIGGGIQNGIGGGSVACTIAGGFANFMWPSNSDYSFIGGGFVNQILHDSAYSSITGGKANFIAADSPYCALGGGSNNTAVGICATVPGGSRNNAGGNYSFAAGHRAKTSYQGDFVWADSTDADFTSSAANQFAARCIGGVIFVTGIDGSGNATSGVQVPAGSGSWTSLSDRNAKENFQAVNAEEVLDRIAAMPISMWNYKTQDKTIRHLGPMAQDFHAAFHIGEDDKHIAIVDESGVALAAIQGLNEKMEEQTAQLRQKDGEIRELKQGVAELKELVSKLSRQVDAK
jgi:Chaperone of endosialidase